MIFNHEHQHVPRVTYAPTPAWAKVACGASIVLVLALLMFGGFR